MNDLSVVKVRAAYKRKATESITEKERKERVYSAILADTPLTKRSDMDHTVLPANHTMSAFPSYKRSPKTDVLPHVPRNQPRAPSKAD